MDYPDFPDILTERDWDRHKGLVAKVLVKTDITEKLGTLHGPYDGLKSALSVGALVGDPARKVKAIKGCRDTQLDKLVTALDAFRRHAKDVLDRKLRSGIKSKVIPSKVGDHVEDMIAAAKKLGEECSDAVDEALKAAEADAEEQEEEAEESAAGRGSQATTKRAMPANLQSLVKEIRLVIAKTILKPSAEDFTNNVRPRIQKLMQELLKHAETKGLVQFWFQTVKEGAMDGVDEAGVKKTAGACNTELKKIEQAFA